MNEKTATSAPEYYFLDWCPVSTVPIISSVVRSRSFSQDVIKDIPLLYDALAKNKRDHIESLKYAERLDGFMVFAITMSVSQTDTEILSIARGVSNYLKYLCEHRHDFHRYPDDFSNAVRDRGNADVRLDLHLCIDPIRIVWPSCKPLIDVLRKNKDLRELVSLNNPIVKAIASASLPAAPACLELRQQYAGKKDKFVGEYRSFRSHFFDIEGRYVAFVINLAVICFFIALIVSATVFGDFNIKIIADIFREHWIMMLVAGVVQFFLIFVQPPPLTTRKYIYAICISLLIAAIIQENIDEIIEFVVRMVIALIVALVVGGVAHVCCRYKIQNDIANILPTFSLTTRGHIYAICFSLSLVLIATIKEIDIYEIIPSSIMSWVFAFIVALGVGGVVYVYYLYKNTELYRKIIGFYCSANILSRAIENIYLFPPASLALTINEQIGGFDDTIKQLESAYAMKKDMVDSTKHMLTVFFVLLTTFLGIYKIHTATSSPPQKSTHTAPATAGVTDKIHPTTCSTISVIVQAPAIVPTSKKRVLTHPPKCP